MQKLFNYINKILGYEDNLHELVGGSNGNPPCPNQSQSCECSNNSVS